MGAVATATAPERVGGLRAKAEAGAVITMQETAVAVGLSYDRFRKIWPQMRRASGFPAPARGRVWLAAAVLGWLVDRSWTPPAAAKPKALSGPSRADAAWEQLERARGQG